MSLVIRKTQAEDIDFIKMLEIACSLCEWSKNDYLLETKRKNSIFLTAEINSRKIGFILARLIPNEVDPHQKGSAEIYNIAIRNDSQREGIGFKLLNKFIQIAEKKHIHTIYLEVRKSNQGAIDFYKKSGFTIIGERKNFYTNPIENAFLMELILPRAKIL